MLMGEAVATNVRDYLITPVEDTGITQINRLENLITLNPLARLKWGCGHFLLQLLESDDRTPMSVDLSHFGETNIPNRYCVKFTTLTTPTEPLSQSSAGVRRLSLPDIEMHDPDTDPTLERMKLFHQRDDSVLSDGRIIVFETHDPENLPLPHPHLLWLHGHLSRVVRLAGRGLNGLEVDLDE
ncbi:hypothetical protein ABW21_db0205168 [Orbilia brochopaga]|nr:hypothetical protein ABW21_db0205168 [Drechslerella brochopaga]